MFKANHHIIFFFYIKIAMKSSMYIYSIWIFHIHWFRTPFESIHYINIMTSLCFVKQKELIEAVEFPRASRNLQSNKYLHLENGKRRYSGEK